MARKGSKARKKAKMIRAVRRSRKKKKKIEPATKREGVAGSITGS